jgi:hypothetical protein
MGIGVSGFERITPIFHHSSCSEAIDGSKLRLSSVQAPQLALRPELGRGSTE